MTQTRPTQRRMQANADQRVLAILRTFNETQTSGNPLTKEEVEKLIERRPEIYSILRGLGV